MSPRAKTLLLLPLALVALVGLLGGGLLLWPSSSPLEVKVTRQEFDHWSFALGLHSFVVEIKYVGKAEAAGLYLETYHDGERSGQRIEVGGIGAFDEPRDRFHMRTMVTVRDLSRADTTLIGGVPSADTASIKLVTSTTLAGDSTVFSSPARPILEEHFSLRGMWVQGRFPDPDPRQQLTPVFFFASGRIGILGAPRIKDGEVLDEVGKVRRNHDYLVFLLKVRHEKTPNQAAALNGG